jgi:hypothetical protein
MSKGRSNKNLFVKNEAKPKWIEELEYRQRNLVGSDRLHLDKLRDELYPDQGPLGGSVARGAELIALGLCLAIAAIAIVWYVLAHAKSLLWIGPSIFLLWLGWRVFRRGVR